MVVPAITEIGCPFSNGKPLYKVKLLVLFWSIWCVAIFWTAQNPTTDLLLVDTMQSTRTSSSIDIICMAIVLTGFTARCLIALNLAHVLLALEVCLLVILRLYYNYLKRRPVPKPKKDATKIVRYILWLCRRAKWTRARLAKLYPETLDLSGDVLEYMGFFAWYVTPKLVKAYDRESRTWWWTAIEVQFDQPIPESVDMTRLN